MYVNIAADDVIGVVEEFMVANAGDSATESIILAMGGEILGISSDALLEKLNLPEN